MRIFLIMSYVIAFGNSFAQPLGKEFFFKEIGWTLVIPLDFKIMDSLDDKLKTEQGKKIIEKSTDVIADYSETKSLVSASKGPFNYVNVTITPFDPKEDGNYDSANADVKDVLMKSFQRQIPGSKVDTSTTSMMIDQLVFDKFELKVSLNERVVVNMVVLSKLYRGYDFGITYVFQDQQTREQIEKMLKESKFAK